MKDIVSPTGRRLSRPLRGAVAVTAVINLIVGAALITRRGTWKDARVLFAVALVYGVVILIALLYHLFLGNAPPVFWIYVLVDAIFLVPIAYIYWAYELS
jgi:hypothetical protein